MRYITSIPFLAILAMSSCSTLSGEKSSAKIAATGPTVVQVRAEPSTIKLDSSLNPLQPATVFADVKDFTSPIQDVRLRFVHVPFETHMFQVSGSTYQATIPPDELRKLAVSGETIKYEIEVIATDGQGKVATSSEPLDFAVEAPEASQLQG